MLVAATGSLLWPVKRSNHRLTRSATKEASCPSSAVDYARRTAAVDCNYPQVGSQRGFGGYYCLQIQSGDLYKTVKRLL